MTKRPPLLINQGKNWIIISVSLAVVALIGTTVYTLQRGGNTAVNEETPPPVAPIKAVSALGRIEPKSEIIRVAASPSMAGAKVKTLLVSQGDVVAQGDLIAVTTDYDSKEAQLNQAKQELRVAEANLAIIQAGAKQGQINAQIATVERLQAQIEAQQEIDQARIDRLQAQITSEKRERQATVARLKAELNNSQSELNRYRQLSQEGVISESDFDARQLNFETAQKRFQESEASYQKTVDTLTAEMKEIEAQTQQNSNTLLKQINEAEARLDEIQEIRTVDVAQAQAQVGRAQSAIKQAEVELELTQIRAPVSGTIIEVMAKEGEIIENSQGVVEMANLDEMLVIAEVYESDISQITTGKGAVITSENNSFSDAINGEVMEISSKIGKKDVLETDPAASVDARVIEVKIAINPEDTEKIKNLIFSQVLVEIAL
ncbi:MAG: HlyD family efflux transporter periplasmic adaptor subunit [Cyanobacterium sp. T60_A2020_053]|nr:HlyD family efflux transporter periplasmic adaptor subunit [Cyanobacterium sp. T60_A2020_053]